MSEVSTVHRPATPAPAGSPAHAESWSSPLAGLFHKCAIRANTWLHLRRYPRVQFGAGVRIEGGLVIKGPGRVIVGARTYFAAESGRPNKITTGDAATTVTIGRECYLNGAELTARAAITIGDACMLGDCLIMDTDFHSVDPARHEGGAVVKNRPVTLADNVWVGARVLILKGVTIGRNSVVGAGAVVRQSVPENVVVIGNPQQIVRELPVNPIKKTTKPPAGLDAA